MCRGVFIRKAGNEARIGIVSSAHAMRNAACRRRAGLGCVSARVREIIAVRRAVTQCIGLLIQLPGIVPVLVPHNGSTALGITRARRCQPPGLRRGVPSHGIRRTEVRAGWQSTHGRLVACQKLWFIEA